jgi:hypothetical protein
VTSWTSQELDRIGQAEELQLATRRNQGGLSRYVTMWVVRAGDGLYVRSAYGPDNPWYRRAQAAKAGRIRAGDLERPVTFETADAAVQDAIDAAYHAKYDRYGPQIVASVTGPDARNVTVRLVKATQDDRAG